MVVEETLDDGTLAVEADLAPLMCAHCQVELDAVGEPWPDTCPACGSRIDLETQFAYIRGRDAFIAGQDLLIKLTPKMRRRNITSPQEMEGLQYYSQAYSALQRAFQGQLAEPQRQLGIEMMAAMSMVIQTHGSISPFESRYWTTLMIELTSQLELVQVGERIAKAPPGWQGILLRWRWNIRRKQLEQVLVKLDENIKVLDQNIVFVERPKARRRTR